MNLYPILENKRVLLQPLQVSDAGLLLPLALTEPELFRYTSFLMQKEGDMARFIGQAMSERDAGKAIPFLVIDKYSNRVAGTTRFANLEIRHKRVEIGWTWISGSVHGSGLNKAMKYLMLEHAFDILELNRVEIKTNERNEKSRNAIESIGGRYEGLFRHHMINEDGTLRNTVYYSILREEWPGLKTTVFSRYRDLW